MLCFAICAIICLCIIMDAIIQLNLLLRITYRLPCSCSIDLDSLGLLQHTAKPNLTGSSSVNEMATSAW